MKKYTVKVFKEDYQTTEYSYDDYEISLCRYNELVKIAKKTGETFTICLYGNYDDKQVLYETETVNPTKIIAIN